MKKTIKKFTDYEIFDTGNVYSHKSKKFLKGRDNSKGYYAVRLYGKVVTARFSIHRLVAEYFLPNPNNYPEVNHKNGIKTDNRVENLEWCTKSHNIKEAFRLGLKDNKGIKHGRCKLTEDNVLEIREKLKTDSLIKDIAKDYGVTAGAISAIKNKRTWTHV